VKVLEADNAKQITCWKINSLTAFMPIVPQIPATFANMLFANWVAAAREFALLALGNYA